ncbi:MAG: CheR family methyltransferase [Sideroxyarcus sp.]|nr:CheR family methyltransferase [Sideroxyarcus sp.]
MSGSMHSRQKKDFSVSVLCEEALCRHIRGRTGIVIQDHQLENLRATVGEICDKFGYASCEELLDSLQQSDRYVAELEWLISRITVGETYFFRDQSQMDYLRQIWLPEVINRKRENGEKTLRIWSAGCSSGQELYSIAIMLHEALPDLESWTLHLLGTDINTDGLSRAIRGEYGEWSFRATNEDIRRQHFIHKSHNQHKIKPQFRSMAKFSFLNLADDSYPSIMTETHAMDLILCRNVFIYFDASMTINVLKKFTNCLVPEGRLLLGASDMMPTSVDGLEFGEWGGMFYYRRADEKYAPQPLIKAPWRPQAFTLPATPSAPQPAVIEMLPAPAAPVSAPPVALEPESIDARIRILLREERWNEAMAAITQYMDIHGETPAMLQHRAKALSNRGESLQAVQLCQRSIELDPLNHHTYLIMALALLELNRMQDAESALRKVIYLNRDFIEAHFHLALLQLRLGKVKLGLKSMENALSAAGRTDPERELHHAVGMTVGRFAEVVKNEILVYDRHHGARSAGLR